MFDVKKSFSDGPQWDGFFEAIISTPSAFGYGGNALDILANPQYQKDLEKEFAEYQKVQKQKKAWLKKMLKNPAFMKWYKDRYGSLKLE